MAVAKDIIEGEFNGFDIRLAREEDFENLNQHFKDHFFRDDPLNKTVGYSEDFANAVAQTWKPLLKQKLSIIAIDQQTGKVAGCRMTSEQRKGHSYPQVQTNSKEGQKVAAVLKSINGTVDVYEKYGVDRYAEFCRLSVDKEFRGRGLASELYDRTVVLLKANGFTHVKSSFSSPISRRLGEKYGFVEVARRRFLDFLDEKGLQLMPNAAPDDVFTLGMLVLLQLLCYELSIVRVSRTEIPPKLFLVSKTSCCCHIVLVKLNSDLFYKFD